MATHVTYHIDKFWDDDFKSLIYKKEQFNDPSSMIEWEDRGFRGPFGGYMCDMRSTQPSWNNTFLEYFKNKGWKNIGTSYYRMDSGSSLPIHVDTFKKYIGLFGLEGKESTIRRAIVFLNDWESGHYAECNGVPIVDWKAGDCIELTWDSPHIATNMGTTPRYTLQVTGHL
jgi:hypothetical protein